MKWVARRRETITLTVRTMTLAGLIGTSTTKHDRYSDLSNAPSLSESAFGSYATISFSPVIHTEIFLSRRHVAQYQRKEMQNGQWSDPGMHCFGMLLDSRAFEMRDGDGDVALVLLFNSHYEPVEFTLPECRHIKYWEQYLSTSDREVSEGVHLPVGEPYCIQERSLALLGWET